MANSNTTQQDLAKREDELRQQAETAARLARGQSVDPRVAQGLSMLAQTNPQEYQRLMAAAGQESTKAGVLADVTQQQQKEEKRVQQQIDQYERQIKNAESLIGQPGFDIDRGELEKAKTNLATIKSDFTQQQADFRDFVSAKLMPFIQVETVTKRRSTDGGRSYYEDKVPQLKVNLKGAIEMGVPDQDLKKIGVSQLDIVRAKKDIRAEENARKVDAIARPIEREREAKAAEQSAAFKRVEKYYNPETKQFSVTKAASEGVSWETVKQAGFDISKEDYETSRLRIVKPDKPQSYEKAEAAFNITADQIWKRTDLSDDQKAEKLTQTREWQRLQDAQAAYAQTLEAGIMSKDFAMIAAEIVVPGLYVARHWNDMSAGERAVNIAVDALTLIPLYGAVVRGARAGAAFGRAAMAKNIVQQMGREAVSQLVAPVDMLLHPAKTVTATGKQVLNLAENIAHPKKIPYIVLTTTHGTVRIPVNDKFTPARAIAARNAIMKKAVDGGRLFIEMGDQLVEVRTSPFMREARKAGGALAHATPAGEPFENTLTVLKKQGMPASEQGIFFSHEPLTRFAESSAFGTVKSTKPTIYITSRETAQAMQGSEKIYRNTAELERILPVNAKLPGPQQRLFTRIGPNADKVQILLEKPLSSRQIARLKAESIIEAVKAPFQPAISIKGTQRVTGLSNDELNLLSNELRRAGNIDQARSLVRVSTALRTTRPAPRSLSSATGPVNRSDVNREEKNLIESGIEIQEQRVPATEDYAKIVSDTPTVLVDSSTRKEEDTADKEKDLAIETKTTERVEPVTETITKPAARTTTASAPASEKPVFRRPVTTSSRLDRPPQTTDIQKRFTRPATGDDSTDRLFRRTKDDDRRRSNDEIDRKPPPPPPPPQKRRRERNEEDDPPPPPPPPPPKYRDENGTEKQTSKMSDKEKRDYLKDKSFVTQNMGKLRGIDIWHVFLDDGTRVILHGAPPPGAKHTADGTGSAYATTQRVGPKTFRPIVHQHGAVTTRITPAGRSGAKPEFLPSRKIGQQYFTKLGGATAISRRPLSRKRKK